MDNRPVPYILDRFRRDDVMSLALRLTVFEKFAVKCEKSVSERPKIVHPKPFLNPEFGDPKDIATKTGEYMSGICSFIITQKFTPIAGTNAEISVPRRKIQIKTEDNIASHTTV